MNRAELVLIADSMGLDPSTYPNDSKLEQKVIYLLKNQATMAGTLASGTLTSDATAPVNLDTVTIGTEAQGGLTYTFVTTLDSAVATGTLTSDATAPSDGDTVTIGTTVYTFKTTLTPTAFEVLIGASAAAALDNLKSAINKTAGGGTTYASATTIHPTVTATTNTDTTQVVEAKTAGPAGDSIALDEAGTHTSWGDTFLRGGNTPAANQVLIGASAAIALDNFKSAVNGAGTPGTDYSANTPVNPLVTATTNTDTTQLVVAVDMSVGEDVSTTETSSHLSWGATTLASGVSDQNAVNAAAANRISGGKNI